MLGTNQNPAWARVSSPDRAQQIVAFCNDNGWKVIIAIDPTLPEDLSDINRILLQEPQKPTPKIGRNEPCPCNSGKKYKKCCLTLLLSPNG